MARMTDEARMDANEARRQRHDAKMDEVMWKREEAAEAMIGTLNSGKFYVFPVGGKYREGSRHDLIAFLIRNRYA